MFLFVFHGGAERGIHPSSSGAALLLCDGAWQKKYVPDPTLNAVDTRFRFVPEPIAVLVGSLREFVLATNGLDAAPGEWMKLTTLAHPVMVCVNPKQELFIDLVVSVYPAVAVGVEHG